MMIAELSESRLSNHKILAERAFKAKRPNSRQFVYYENGSDLGYVSFDLRPEIATLVIYEVYVLPDLRFKKIGSQLMEFSDSLCLEAGLLRSRLKPSPLDSGIDEGFLKRWYEKLGFVPVNDGTGEYLKTFTSPNRKGPQ